MDPVLLTTFGTLIILLIFTVPIGVSIGKDTYKDTDHAMTPHFGAAEMQEMVDSGLISIQSHTYDMHQWPPFEDGNDRVRETLAQLPGESDADYEAAVRADIQQSQQAHSYIYVDLPPRFFASMSLATG